PGDRRSPWSRTVRRTADGSLAVGGRDVRDIAAEHGTPVYVLDESDLRARARTFVTAFRDAFADLAGADVYYASKAFASVAVLRWVHEEGMHVDVSTGGELAVALRAGVPGQALALHGNNKSDAELERALRAGVGRIVLDSLGEVDRVADLAGRLGLRAPVMVRVTTGVDAVLARPALTLLGLHSHIGSQILDLSGFEVAAAALLRLRAEVADQTGTLMPELDLGGGYGISYTGADAPPASDRVATTLA